MLMFNIDFSFFANIVDVLSDIFTLLLLIIYLALFFGVQYYLIKGYIFIAKSLYTLIPTIKELINKITPNLTKKYSPDNQNN